MEQSDQPQFARMLTGLAQVFQTSLSAEDLVYYWQLLRRFPLPTLETAMMSFCSSPEGYRFMPKPGEIIAKIEGSGSAQASRAWTKVLHAVRRVGAYRTVVFDDRIIQAVIWDIGGWQTLCAMLITDESFRAKEFEKRYLSYWQNPPSRYPKQLSGIVDTINAARGYSNAMPVTLIGEKSQALVVWKNGQDSDQLLSIKRLSVEAIQQLLPDQSEETKE